MLGEIAYTRAYGTDMRLEASSDRAVLYRTVCKMTVVYMTVFQLSLHLCTFCSSIEPIACVAQLKEVGKRSLCSLYIMYVNFV